MTFEEVEQLGNQIRAILRETHDDHFNRCNDSHHKSYEGAFEISLRYPDYFAYDDESPEWSVSISSYLFADHGRSWEGPLSQAIPTVLRWRDNVRARSYSGRLLRPELWVHSLGPGNSLWLSAGMFLGQSPQPGNEQPPATSGGLFHFGG